MAARRSSTKAALYVSTLLAAIALIALGLINTSPDAINVSRGDAGSPGAPGCTG
jgi:hypothetical protein